MSEKRTTNRLIALGSAAVIAVYAAGYARTRAVALRLAEDDHRRPLVPGTPESGPVPAMPEPPAAPAVVPAPSTPSAPPRAPRRRRENREPHASTSVPAVATTPSSAIDPVTTATPTPIAPTPIVPAPLVTDPKPTEPAPPPKPVWKDGTYYGWGTSRHGDIQASVVIENGRITNASIAQCLTRYSCSWIAPLVPQVVQRQSADVDYVSGATQSTNAFYYAILEALSKAK